MAWSTAGNGMYIIIICMPLLLIHMQKLQDLSESQNPLDVQREHSTLDSDTVQHTSGPVCAYCKAHLLTPTARVCANCGYSHRASAKRTPKESITSQETNPSSSEMDTQDKQFKYSLAFGAQSSAQVLSLPAGTQVQRNQEASSRTGINVTVKDFLTRLEREKNVRVSVPAAIPTPNISTETATAVNDMLKKNPRKRKSSSNVTNEQFFIKHFRPDDMSDRTEIDPMLYFSSDKPNKMSGAAVSGAKNDSSTSPETETRVDLNPSHSSDVGCFVYAI